MEKISLVILGAGGHGNELASYVEEMAAQGQKVELVGFVDQNKPAGPFANSRILGDFQALERFLRKNAGKRFYYLTATGDNASRRSLVRQIERFSARNLKPWTLRHPLTAVGRDVVIGEGTCLAPGSIVTTCSRIGKHCILNVNASVSHDCIVGDLVNLNPGAVVCGNVRIAPGCTIGAGATVIDKIRIGEWSVIGAGAVVVDDVPPRVTVVGVPARIIKKHPV